MNDLKRLNLLTSEINGVFHDASARMGLSDSVSIILYTLTTLGGSCQLADLVRMSGTSKQTINSALRKLEQEQLIRLEPTGTRRKLVCLTEGGKALADSTVAHLIVKENEVLATFTAEDREAYLRLTQRYLDGIREKFKEIL